ncbi:MAG: pyridoxal-phosphate dependent enzyme, partial [Dermatophilaceae bacterium]
SADDLLAVAPTPIERADRLAVALGLSAGQLWVKRDDLTRVGAGGNKARKLHRLFIDAQAHGSDLVLTGGGPQSNHSRQTAAAAARLGMPCHLVLAGDAPERPSGNLVLNALLGAVVTWSGATSLVAVDDALAEQERRLRAAGHRPYLIPVGGTSPVGTLGSVSAAREILEDLPDAALVVTATGSAGTHAGLAVGFGDHGRVWGVNIGAYADAAQRVGVMAREAATLAGMPPPAGTPQVDERFTPLGYGTPTTGVLAALRLAARAEGLVLDPVYTGKTLAGLSEALADGSLRPDGPVVFMHTGGLPGLLSAKYESFAGAAG